jgi:succinate dehydrogenase hydrophobic anchor subunit
LDFFRSWGVEMATVIVTVIVVIVMLIVLAAWKKRNVRIVEIVDVTKQIVRSNNDLVGGAY